MPINDMESESSPTQEERRLAASLLGKIKTDKKAKAARENGKKPKKKK